MESSNSQSETESDSYYNDDEEGDLHQYVVDDQQEVIIQCDLCYQNVRFEDYYDHTQMHRMGVSLASDAMESFLSLLMRSMSLPIHMPEYHADEFIERAPVGIPTHDLDTIAPITTLLDKAEEVTCPICLEDVSQMPPGSARMTTECKHVYCDKCLKDWFRAHTTCPVCMKDFFMR